MNLLRMTDDCLVSVLCEAGTGVSTENALIFLFLAIAVSTILVLYMNRRWRLQEERDLAKRRAMLEAWVAEDPENRKMPPESNTIRVWG